MSVTHCVCRQVPLAVVVQAAHRLRAQGILITLNALCDDSTAGTGCGSCRPYMARAALTGVTILPVMTNAQCDWWLRRLTDER